MLGVLTLGYLRRHCRGRANARTAARIARDLLALGIEATDRTVRDAAGALVLAGWPVGTAAGKPGGVFVCDAREDFAAARHNLTTRLRAQAERVRRFDETVGAALSGQQIFDFVEADGAFAELERAPLLTGAGGGP